MTNKDNKEKEEPKRSNDVNNIEDEIYNEELARDDDLDSLEKMRKKRKENNEDTDEDQETDYGYTANNSWH